MSFQTSDEHGTYSLIVSGASGLLSHITASGAFYFLTDVVRVAFSTATAIVSILVGIAGLIKWVAWWKDRRASQRREQRLQDNERRLVEDMMVELTKEKSQ